MTERLHFHFSLSCIGEGNGNPLQCSCLENPRDRGAWWAAVYGVAQSWTRLKWLSSHVLETPCLSLSSCLPATLLIWFLGGQLTWMKSPLVSAGTLNNSSGRTMKALYPSPPDWLWTRFQGRVYICQLCLCSYLRIILHSQHNSKACRSWAISRGAYLPWWEKGGMFLFFLYSLPPRPLPYTQNPGELFLWVLRGPLYKQAENTGKLRQMEREPFSAAIQPSHFETGFPTQL